MSVSPTETVSPSGIEFEDANLRNIGIEVEYPIGDGEAASLRAGTSRDLRSEVGRGNPWRPDGTDDIPTGEMTSDHVGAEIVSDVLNLHSGEPEQWYRATIEEAEAMGYPFGAHGRGDTNFGLHLHLSEMPQRQMDFINDLCGEPWSRVFFCTSIESRSIDPWRHGGISSQTSAGNWHVCRDARSYHSGDQHREFRLPEPMLPDHFELVVEFLRRLERFGQANAREFAAEKVVQRDERLTAIRRYKRLRDERADFPREEAIQHRNDYDEQAAQFMAELMGDA